MTDKPARSLLGTVIDFLFGYDGRIGRGAYWLGLASAAAVAGLIAGFADQLVAGTGDIGRYVVVAIIVGTFLWIHSAISVKRLHDRDRSGAWYLVYGVLPTIVFVLAIYLYAIGEEGAALIPSLVFLIAFLWVSIDLGLMSGTPGPNRFGPQR